MSITAVLGIGSPFGDDRVGWQVIKLLEQNASIKNYIPNSLHLECHDRPGTNLFALTQSASKIILIDAVKTGAAIGTCHQFQQKEIEQLYPSISTHGIGIGYALKLGFELQLLPEDITLYGIEIGEISYTKELSPPIRRAAIQLHDFLTTLLLSIQQ